MKILVIASNRENMPERVAPLGAYIVADRLLRLGHQVEFLDLAFCDSSEKALREAILKKEPELIAISIRNIELNSFPQATYILPLIKVLVDSCRNLTKAKILLGGTGFSIMPKTIFSYLGADYGLVGEAEKNIDLFIEGYKNKNLSNCSGLLYKDKNGKVVFNERKISDAIDASLTKRFNYDNYPSINIQTKRGCVFKCNYCVYPGLEGSKVRLKEPLKVVDEIEFFASRRKPFYFVDSVFNFPVEHAIQICKEIIQRKINIKWSSQIQPRYMDSELAILMAKAGCQSVSIGIDTLSESVLESIGKSFSLEEVGKCNQLLKKNNIEANYYLLFGHLGEDAKAVKETFQNIKLLNLDKGLILTGVRVHPNTQLARKLEQKGLLKESLTPTYCFFGEKHNEMLHLIQSLAKKFPTWTFPGLRLNLRSFDKPNLEEYMALEDWQKATAEQQTAKIL